MTPPPAVHKVGSEDQVRDVWENYWDHKSQTGVSEWDVLAETCYYAIQRAISSVAGKSFIEVGSGTGRLSRQLYRDGGHVALLDITSGALTIAREKFAGDDAHGGPHGKQIGFIRGSMFSIPCQDGSFDVVWNSGVLEHFTDEEQVQAIAEMLRVTKSDGAVLAIVPYSFSPVYRIGKFLLEITGRWPYGIERPIRSYRWIAERLNLELDEYRFCFLPLIEQVLLPIPKFGPRRVARLSARWLALGSDEFKRLDQRLSNLFIGCYLCCTFRRRGAPPP